MQFFVRTSDLGNGEEFSYTDAASAIKQARVLLKQNRTGVSIHDAHGNRLEGMALRALVFPDVRGATELLLEHLSFAWIELIQFAWKKRARMAMFGINSPRELPLAEIDLEPFAVGCVPVCGEIVNAHRYYLSKYLSNQDSLATSRWWKGIPLLIDLDRYPDFESYSRYLKHQSKGAALRQIRNARRTGFYCKQFDRRYHCLDLFEIETSRKFRSGPVLAAFLRRRPQHAERPAAAPAPLTPLCPRHWYMDWGIFITDPEIGGDRLVGYAYLKRVGNIVRTTALLGHGANLSQSIMKLLFVEVMKWLLERSDPLVKEIRYLHYGALEHGSAGLLTWKRRFQFEPVLFRWPSRPYACTGDSN